MAVYTRLMAQVGVITGDDKYLVGVCRHNQRSAASFSRITPDWRNNHVMETFWDDFWFGKRPMFGDVTPHYWTALVGDDQIAIEMTFKGRQIPQVRRQTIRFHLRPHPTRRHGHMRHRSSVPGQRRASRLP